ncbi:MAG: hypothetical protein CVT62_07090 [Actinobacteria bacterium HGW-Actinobacteria-2]|nr:MAG: hypothetical protein CVT62_07090 [Actinobacteria bacterium HGW-Actinobacteria-2]
MQPFLLMKQTLDSAFDPGPLLLYGPNVKNTQIAQVFSRGKAQHDHVDHFTVGIEWGDKSRSVTYVRKGDGLAIRTDDKREAGQTVRLTQPMTPSITAAAEAAMEGELTRLRSLDEPPFKDYEWSLRVDRSRCFLTGKIYGHERGSEFFIPFPFDLNESHEESALLRGIIHVPGLRGNPERAYVRSATGDTFPGTFETYMASIVTDWAESRSQKLSDLSTQLERLGLTWKLAARRLNDASVELVVGRTPHAQQGGAHDLVSVADVGFGVSQVLPVLVALLEARPGQIVYLEQPEIHLHPRAQAALAEHLVVAAGRGVRVIVETHSNLLIRGIQTHIALGTIRSSDVSMNWFSRDPQTGIAEVAVAELDEKGRFGDWPTDFDDISRDTDWAYIEASENA